MREQDNVAVVDRCYEAFGKGDIEAFRALMADDIEWDTPEVEGHSFGGHRVGGQQLREFFRLLNESEEVLLFEPQEFIAQGEKVAVAGHRPPPPRRHRRTPCAPVTIVNPCFG